MATVVARAAARLGGSVATGNCVRSCVPLLLVRRRRALRDDRKAGGERKGREDHEPLRDPEVVERGVAHRALMQDRGSFPHAAKDRRSPFERGKRTLRAV
jgi:hypothetical protein